MKKTIGQNIAYFRKKCGMTQEELSEKMNVTAQAVSKWENNLSYPDPDGLQRLAAIFDISMDALFHGEDALPMVKVSETDDFGKRILIVKIIAKDPSSGQEGKVILRFPVQMVLKMAEEEGGLESLFGENATFVDEVVALIKSGAVGCVLDADSGHGGNAHVSIEVIDYDN